MINVAIVYANELELDEYVDLQIDAFASHLAQYSVSTAFINSDLFSWKYS